jgi:hypothetical protein
MSFLTLLSLIYRGVQISYLARRIRISCVFCRVLADPRPHFVFPTKQKIGSSLTLNQTRKLAIPNHVVGDTLIPWWIPPKPNSPLREEDLQKEGKGIIIMLL